MAQPVQPRDARWKSWLSVPFELLGSAIQHDAEFNFFHTVALTLACSSGPDSDGFLNAEQILMIWQGLRANLMSWWALRKIPEAADFVQKTSDLETLSAELKRLARRSWSFPPYYENWQMLRVNFVEDPATGTLTESYRLRVPTRDERFAITREFDRQASVSETEIQKASSSLLSPTPSSSFLRWAKLGRGTNNGGNAEEEEDEGGRFATVGKNDIVCRPTDDGVRGVGAFSRFNVAPHRVLGTYAGEIVFFVDYFLKRARLRSDNRFVEYSFPLEGKMMEQQQPTDSDSVSSRRRDPRGWISRKKQAGSTIVPPGDDDEVLFYIDPTDSTGLPPMPCDPDASRTVFARTNEAPGATTVAQIETDRNIDFIRDDRFPGVIFAYSVRAIPQGGEILAFYGVGYERPWLRGSGIVAQGGAHGAGSPDPRQISEMITADVGEKRARLPSQLVAIEKNKTTCPESSGDDDDDESVSGSHPEQRRPKKRSRSKASSSPLERSTTGTKTVHFALPDTSVSDGDAALASIYVYHICESRRRWNVLVRPNGDPIFPFDVPSGSIAGDSCISLRTPFLPHKGAPFGQSLALAIDGLKKQPVLRVALQDSRAPSSGAAAHPSNQTLVGPAQLVCLWMFLRGLYTRGQFERLSGSGNLASMARDLRTNAIRVAGVCREDCSDDEEESDDDDDWEAISREHRREAQFFNALLSPETGLLRMEPLPEEHLCFDGDDN